MHSAGKILRIPAGFLFLAPMTAILPFHRSGSKMIRLRRCFYLAKATT
jgi:hypothetical protein